MASSKEYLSFIKEQLSELDDVAYRAMMGEYIIYYRGKIVGGIYDDRLLVKPTCSARGYMPNCRMKVQKRCCLSIMSTTENILPSCSVRCMMSSRCRVAGRVVADKSVR